MSVFCFVASACCYFPQASIIYFKQIQTAKAIKLCTASRSWPIVGASWQMFRCNYDNSKRGNKYYPQAVFLFAAGCRCCASNTDAVRQSLVPILLQLGLYTVLFLSSSKSLSLSRLRARHLTPTADCPTPLSITIIAFCCY